MLQIKYIFTVLFSLLTLFGIAQTKQPKSNVLVRNLAKEKQYSANSQNCFTCRWQLENVNQREPLPFDNVPFSRIIARRKTVLELAEQSLSTPITNEDVRSVTNAVYIEGEFNNDQLILLSKKKNSLQQKAHIKYYNLPGFGKVVKEIRFSSINLRSGVETLDFTFQFYNFKINK